ncbi:MAG: orotidine-5'-phosphate decarboxylase [Nitrospirae bacterium]|nr:orotidine-5'-phosphate decarboxylase [Nitrospirota bacterium]
MNNEKGIIFAADIIDKSSLLKIITEVSPFIKAIKIGNIVLYEHGWKIISEIKKISDLPIILDLKFMDIPDMAEKVAKAAYDVKADGVMLCGATGSNTISEFMRYHKTMKVFVFTEFTHCDGEINKTMADKYIETAVTLGCDGVQVPGTKEKRIREVRENVGNDLIIICCGIGSQKACGKGNETTNFGSAIEAGADYEIIGRAIYESNTPREAALIAQTKIKNVLNNE